MNKKMVMALAILFAGYVFTKNSVIGSAIEVIPEVLVEDIVKDSEAKVESKDVKDEFDAEKMVKPLIKPEAIVVEAKTKVDEESAESVKEDLSDIDLNEEDFDEEVFAQELETLFAQMQVSVENK